MSRIPAPVRVRLTLLGPETNNEGLEAEMFGDPVDGGPDDFAGEDTLVAFVEEVFEENAVTDEE
jgi:hypothetical protein